LTQHHFSVSVIPHTRQQTTLLSKKPGEIVNLECDMIAKYLAKFQNPENSENPGKTGAISRTFLAEHGYF
ncbi:MAG: riboflavin synthase, partial [Oscillospiraceae bacterium]|nr:riboflavin synthase [Oscillospiraceae bacterium]